MLQKLAGDITGAKGKSKKGKSAGSGKKAWLSLGKRSAS